VREQKRGGEGTESGSSRGAGEAEGREGDQMPAKRLPRLLEQMPAMLLKVVNIE
jgi:hypothetical protein